MKERGITLIALVITVIILLILAGVAVSIGLNEDNLFAKANEAKDEWNTRIWQEENKINEVWDMSKTINRKKTMITITGESPINLKIGEERTLIANKTPNDSNTTISWHTSDNSIAMIDQSGKITPMGVGTTTITASADSSTSNEITVTVSSANASEVLVVNKDATIPEKKSPYVNYVDKNGNIILCRVLYDSSSQYGIEIISDAGVDDVTLGTEDPTVSAADFGYSGSLTLTNQKKIAGASYNKAKDTLNAKAVNYLDNNGIANRVRCVGSDPGSPADSSTYNVTTNYIPWKTQGWGNNVFRGSSNTHSTDSIQMKNLNIYKTNPEYSYWLASRITDVDISSDNDGMGAIYGNVVYVPRNNGNYGGDGMIFWVTKDSVYAANKSHKLRPVFHLSENVKIVSGNGTLEKPYNLSL